MARKFFDKETLPAIARRLRALRHLKRLSQQEIADELGIPKNTWAGYESGKCRIPLDTGFELYRRWSIDPKWTYAGIEADMKHDMLKQLNAQLAKDSDDSDGTKRNGAAA